MDYRTFIELDENKVKDLWIHELNPEKSIENAICINIRKDSRLIMCNCENPILKDEMGCYLYVYEDGKIRPVTNAELIYEIDHIKYNLYARYNEEMFVTEIVSDKIYYEPQENDLFIERVFGDMNKQILKYAVYDENEYFNYKIVDNKMVKIPLQEKIESVKISKTQDLSIKCSEEIRNGFSINDDHYSLEIEDQSNIQSLYISALNSNLPLLCHADGKVTREYTKEEVIELYNKMEEIKNKNLLLFNYLKATINESNDAEFINSMEFSEEFLSDKYKELLNK